MQKALGILEAFRDDLDKGFLDDFLFKVEAEVAPIIWEASQMR